MRRLPIHWATGRFLAGDGVTTDLMRQIQHNASYFNVIRAESASRSRDLSASGLHPAVESARTPVWSRCGHAESVG
jgi:hypothetical protein